MSADVALLCFGYAGASAFRFQRFRNWLPSWIDLHLMELPGHGRRIGEPLQQTLAGMVDAVWADVTPHTAKPFALFGHSLGAMVAFEVALRLTRAAAARPLVLFASAASAPSRRDRERYARLDTDAAVKAELLRLSGTPALALEDEQLMELMLPILKADFRACAGYARSPDPALQCPVRVYAGRDDDVPRLALEAWREHSAEGCSLEWWPGGHFFVHEHEPAIVGDMVSVIEEARLSRARAAALPGAVPARPSLDAARVAHWAQDGQWRS
jgi:surfactin synthase thioesterase subunit